MYVYRYRHTDNLKPADGPMYICIQILLCMYVHALLCMYLYTLPHVRCWRVDILAGVLTSDHIYIYFCVCHECVGV